MGSSESGGGNGVVDSRIGTIVWVRRRNGSWWPGKILGMDELSASHLMSPRSGTPVKLLGREDASVDWYNLEKSKRVKKFRCGEFDDCIERAEASLGLPSKKREKYARREDAILHALELEKEILEKKYGKEGANSSIRNNPSAGKDLCTSLGALKNGNGRDESVELKQFQKILVSPSVDECNANPLSTQRVVGNAWQRSVISESNPLIGSQDFILPKKIVSLASSPLHKETSDDHAQAVSACGDVDSGYSTDKAKGLLDHSIEESSIKRHDRRHLIFQNSTTWPGHSLQLEGDAFSISGVNNPEEEAKVKRRRLLYLHSQFTDAMDIKGDSSSQMANLASHPGLGSHSHADVFGKAATSESLEDTESESDSSETDSMEQYTNVERITYADVNAPMALQSTALNSLEMQGDHASREQSDESFPHHTPHFYEQNPISLDMGISRWQMKGKRNDRGFPKRPLDKISYGTYLEPRSSVQRPSHNLSNYNGHDGYSNGVDFIEDDPEPYIEEHGSREHIRKSQVASRKWNCAGSSMIIEDDPEPYIEEHGSREHIRKSQVASRKWNCAGSSMINRQELTWRGSAFGGYLGSSLGSFNSHGGLHGQELLLDVDLKVQANHRREHVPFVSLMSRLNGKPIIGHPVQIETLGDGSTDAIVASADAFEDFESDDENREPPAWTTARRTSKFRGPRPYLSSHLDGIDNQHIDQNKNSLVRKSVSGNAHAKKKILAKKKSRHVPKVPSSERKNPPKRSSLSSSQKTRPLSSIGMDRNLVSEPRHSGLISYMDGVVKPLDSVPPIVACIPVKLVFSRLLEAIGRPPSMSSSLNKGFSEQ